MATDTNTSTDSRYDAVAGNYYATGDDAGCAFKYGVTFGTLASTTWLSPHRATRGR